MFLGYKFKKQISRSIQGASHFFSVANCPHPKSLSLRERDFKSGSLLPQGEGLGMRAISKSGMLPLVTAILQ